MSDKKTGVMEDTDAALNKAASEETLMVEAVLPEDQATHKNRANLYFKRAMVNDGNADYKGKVLD